MPQGSLAVSRYGGKMYYSNAKKLNPWRRAITSAVVGALPTSHTAIDTPVKVVVKFYMPRPKSATRAMPTVAPDLDKLQRAVGDALTDSKIYVDDSRVVAWAAEKWYASDEHETGVDIEVWVL